MLSPEERQAVGAVTTQLRIIIGALTFGLLSYTVFAVVRPEPPDAEGRLAPMAALMAGACVVAAIVVPRIIAAQQRKEIVGGISTMHGKPEEFILPGDAGKLLMGYQTRRIITAALLEGPGFFNAFAYQMERVPYTLGVLIALLLGLAALFPLRTSVEQWLETELRAVRELRQLRG